MCGRGWKGPKRCCCGFFFFKFFSCELVWQMGGHICVCEIHFGNAETVSIATVSAPVVRPRRPVLPSRICVCVLCVLHPINSLSESLHIRQHSPLHSSASPHASSLHINTPSLPPSSPSSSPLFSLLSLFSLFSHLYFSKWASSVYSSTQQAPTQLW